MKVFALQLEMKFVCKECGQDIYVFTEDDKYEFIESSSNGYIKVNVPRCGNCDQKLMMLQKVIADAVRDSKIDIS